MRQDADYVPLASRSSLDVSTVAATGPEKDHEPRAKRSETNNRLVIWACAGALFSSVLSFIVVLGGVLDSRAPTSAQAPYGQVLRRPNPYINLDKALSIGNYSFAPITNFPPVVMQIDTTDSARRMKEDHRQWRSNLGTVYPDDRHILVSSKMSTIVQFLNIDYAMERCVLTASLPHGTELFDPAIRLSDPTVVDVWTLDTTNEISPHIANSWERAPPRRELLATLTFSAEGSSNSSEFPCPSNEFTTLELACANSARACDVDLWQDQRAVPRGGFFMTQYQSPVRVAKDRRQ